MHEFLPFHRFSLLLYILFKFYSIYMASLQVYFVLSLVYEEFFFG